MPSTAQKNLLQKLHEYIPQEAPEIAAKERIVSFVEREPNCFERSLECGHITASAWLVSRDFSKALLMLHTKLGIWVQLGGHSDGNPDVLAVAIQEAREESGIQGIRAVSDKIFDLDVHLIPSSPGIKEHHHYDIRFLLQVATDEEVVQNRESKALQWFGQNLDDLPTGEPSILRMHSKWLKVLSAY